MNSRKAAAVAMSIIAIACRICGIFMSAMTVLLCFSGLTAKLQIVGFVVELSRALPSARAAAACALSWITMPTMTATALASRFMM